jgi:hypothetical protein
LAFAKLQAMFALLFFWVGFSIAVAVAANTRGRDGVGWFFLALLISPLLAGIIVLASPSLAVTTSSLISGPFVPEAMFHGIPYRTRKDMSIEAITPGGRVIFKDTTQLAAFLAGESISEMLSPEIMKNYPKTLNGFRYRVDNGKVLALTPVGTEANYPDWKSFWAAAHENN